MQGFKRKEYDKGVYFVDKILKVKLYDAGYRIKTVPDTFINALKSDIGFKRDTYYIRVENHYLKPQIHFKERNIKLETLFNESFNELCKIDLINTYKSISKMKPHVMPSDKKLLNSSTIILLCLMELSMFYGFDAEKELLSYLKGIPKEFLPTNDRKQRKRLIIENFVKVSMGGSTPEYDLLEKLQTAFY
ncbi:hypothetical protein [Emticicia sp.]|uniref:hypothetical protein n=1 Tax=Emticicia sp. TaxID=1930953 RepID=UPI003750AD88